MDISYKGVQRTIIDAGFSLVRAKGGHEFYRHGDGRTFVISRNRVTRAKACAALRVAAGQVVRRCGMGIAALVVLAIVGCQGTPTEPREVVTVSRESPTQAPTTDYPAPRTDYPAPTTDYPAPSHDNPTPSTDRPVSLTGKR